MPPILRGERGISPIVGLIIIIGLFASFIFGVWLKQETPIDWEEEEYRAMMDAKESFLTFKSDIIALKPGQMVETHVPTGVSSPTALLSSSSSAVVNIVGARYAEDADEVYYYDDYFDNDRYLHTYVSESNPDMNYRSGSYDNDHLYVSTTSGGRMRTYLKFDLTETHLYDDDENKFYDDIQIYKAQLYLHVNDTDLAEEPSNVMESQIPFVAELWAVENNDWDESITWNTQPHDDTTEDRDRILDNVDISDEGEWISFGGRDDRLTRYMKRRWENIGDGENQLSFVIREPEAWDPSTMNNRAKFNSAEYWVNRKDDLTPRLRITYSRHGRTAYARRGMLDLGYIEYRAQNMYFGDQYYTYEGGMVISQRYGWYDTVLSWPEELVSITPLPESKELKIDVIRRQIEPSSIEGEATAGVGRTSIRVQREEEEWLVEKSRVPNRNEVKITINTDHPSSWRDYLERLAAEVSYYTYYTLTGVWDLDYWSPYATYDTDGDGSEEPLVKYDYATISLTIYGPDAANPNNQDIYYSERVIWLDTSTGFFQSGRT